MPNTWFRLYSEFATDPKVQMMSEANQRRFIMVLCMRCSNDHVTLHDEEVAFQLRISNEEWATTKAVFLAKGLINEDNSPTSWDKRQFVSDSSAERVARHRAKKKPACNVTVTPPDTDTDTEADTEKPSAPPVPDPELPQNLLPAAALPAPPKIPPQETALQAACKATWAAYSAAYAERYGEAPIRTAKASSQTKQVVQSLGFDEAPMVAAWFVTHPGGFYVTKGHDIGLLLADVGKLRTEWATGRVITSGSARQSDRAGTTMAALQTVLAERGEML